VLAELDAVMDVGGVYDPCTDRYDHHQRGFSEVFGHGFCTKLSSAGLVYKHYGEEVVAGLMGLPQTHADVHKVYLAVYRSFMECVSFRTIPSHPIPSHPIPSHPIPSHPIPSHPIPSHRILRYLTATHLMCAPASRAALTLLRHLFSPPHRTPPLARHDFHGTPLYPLLVSIHSSLYLLKMSLLPPVSPPSCRLPPLALPHQALDAIDNR
ncbi:unnamed protein product, partial [Closterium sp. NIES-53]